MICSDHTFAVDIPRKLTLYCFKVFPVVPEAPPLANWYFIEYLRHPANKFVVISGFAYVEPFPGGLANLTSEARRDLSVEPVVVALDGKPSNGFPLRMVLIFWFDVRQPLPK